MGNLLKAKNMTVLDYIAVVLVTVGALAWGLFAFSFRIVDVIFGYTLASWIYGLVGIAGVYSIVRFIARK